MIYFAQNAKTQAVKIGHTTRKASSRLSQLQTGSDTKLQLIGVMDGNVKIERELHNQFMQHRIRGEWFAWCDDIAMFVKENCRPIEQTSKQVSMKRNTSEMAKCGRGECGAAFRPKRSTQSYCSSECRIKANNAKRKSGRAWSDVVALTLQTKKSNGEMVRCDGVTTQLTRCSNQVYVNGTNRPGGKKNRQRYCSGSCRQRSFRLREKHGAGTNQQIYSGAAVLS